mmetsp:Transcript_30416/g.70034  ORF Transcript_30416/g.70034 Transcript_30416/m.70034 type:complete len:134 (+) Transcript_30416:84-485(+)
MARAKNIIVKVALVVLALALCVGSVALGLTHTAPGQTQLQPRSSSGWISFKRIGNANTRRGETIARKASGGAAAGARLGSFAGVCEAIESASLLSLAFSTFLLGSLCGSVYPRLPQAAAYLKRKVVCVATARV